MAARHPLAKILFLDIENTPNLAWVWDKYQQDVIKFEREWNMLCFAWKWQHEKTTHVLGLPDFPTAYKKDSNNDYQLCLRLRELLDEADIVVAHNGRDFDVRKINARFLRYDIPPPSPYSVVDTLLTLRKHFKMNSNSLKDSAIYLGLTHKMETGGFDLWFKCIQGDTKAWTKMMRYNKRDIVVLEELYLRLRPWMDVHPNVTLQAGLDYACPRCGKTTTIREKGWRSLKSYLAKRYVCLKEKGGCGRWSTGERVKIAHKLLQ